MRSWQTSPHGYGSHQSKWAFSLRPTGGGEHEERAEDLESSQRVRNHLVAYYLAPAIIDFIAGENRECSNNELEQKLMLLHSECSKEIEPSRPSSTHHPLIVGNPVDKKGSEFMRRGMRWEAPSMPTAAYDPGLLREQETPLVIVHPRPGSRHVVRPSVVIILVSSTRSSHTCDESWILT